MNQFKQYTKTRFERDNIKKHRIYFESWYSNLTESQLYYFKKDYERTVCIL